MHSPSAVSLTALLLAVVVLPSFATAAPADALASAEAALLAGRYDEAAAAAARAGERVRSEADGLRGAALVARGRYAEARRLLEQTVARDPRALRARVELGLVYRATGERKTERSLWEHFYDDYDAGRIDKTGARELFYMAQATRYYGGWQDANDLFRDAVNADPKGPVGARANVEWAALFLEKYDAGHAEACLTDALKVLPDDPDARTLLARVKLEQGYDVPPAERALARALAKNPRHAGALAIKAELDVDNEQYPEAIALANLILAVNPEDVRAHELIAASKLLREDARGFDAERDHVLKTNPLASRFFAGVAELLIKAHRYSDGAQLLEEAVKRDPKDFVALAELGADYLRIGDETRGLDALRRAWDGDPFNVRTYNLLNLFEKVIPGKYTVVEGRPFRLRVSTGDRALVERYVKPMLAREYAELTKRYGFVPEGPLTIELFDDQDHYAVRTVGLPGLDALGVTFGRVITAMSPSLAKFNWGMTLWHEVGHVFSVQLSNYRVPRWFTEGLSEYETERARPEWTRRTHAELWHAVEEGRLLPVTELNAGFARARDVSHMVVAYHQAAETVAFLIRRFGFDKAVAALKLYAAGKETREVIPKVTGLDVRAFDAAFRSDLVARLQPYRGTFFVRASDYSDLETLEERVKAHPEDARAAGLYALGLLARGRTDDADAILKRGLKPNDTQNAREIVLAGALYGLKRKDTAAAKTFFQALVDHGGDGYDARYGLGTIAAEAGEVAEAEKQLSLAKKYDPDRADPYVELGTLYLKSKAGACAKGCEDKGLVELEAAARLDCMDPSIPKLLIEKLAAKARWAKVAELAPLALYTDPFDIHLHLRLARAYLALGRSADAKFELAAARECEGGESEKRELEELAKQVK